MDRRPIPTSMKYFLTFITVVFIAFMFSLKNNAQPAPEPRTPVLVELFTSEGCSSCPPADKLLVELKENQPVANAQVIALGQHVDYWNQIGWTDRFSSPQFTARQEQYADRLHDGPYTPQIVVDGIASVVGNDTSGVNRAISKAAAVTKPVQVELSNTGGDVHITLHGVAKSSPEVFFALVEDDLESHVKAGENNGVTLHHVAVARELRFLGRASGDGWKTVVPIQLPSGQRKEKTQALVFVQESGGKVVGVSTIALR
jgi:hypothetical protein